MESGTKKYGLTVPKKKLGGVMKTTNIFGDDSDSENEAKKKPVQTNNRTKAQQRSAKLVIDKALKEDATIFQYDEVYDEIDKKKENNEEKKKKADNKPRYIQNLLVQAEKRKIEYERRNERLIQKEREAEGDEFRDKDAFVTSSYKKKLEEMKKMDEEDLKLSMVEDINDVTKQKDMGSFYRHLYKAELCKDENNDEIKDVEKPIKKSDPNRQYRKRASSNSSNDSDNKNYDDKDTDISDSDSSGGYTPKHRKLENQDDEESEDGEIIERPKIEKPKINSEKKASLVIEKSKENIQEKASNDKLESNETTDKETSKSKKTKKNGIDKPKEVVPKINIWKKRTVGDIFEMARQRYFERKMKQINLHARS